MLVYNRMEAINARNGLARDAFFIVFFIFLITFCQFSKKQSQFKLQVRHSLLMTLKKIIRYTSCYFNKDPLRVPKNLTTF
jgi:hypothetical protein